MSTSINNLPTWLKEKQIDLTLDLSINLNK